MTKLTDVRKLSVIGSDEVGKDYQIDFYLDSGVVVIENTLSYIDLNYDLVYDHDTDQLNMIVGDENYCIQNEVIGDRAILYFLEKFLT